MAKQIEFTFADYKGLAYPLRIIKVFGRWRNVGPDILERMLITENGGYTDNDARYLDEDICCYVNSKEFFTLSDYKLGKYVEKEIYDNKPD